MKSIYLAHNMSSQEYGLQLQRKIEALGIKVYNPFLEIEQNAMESPEPDFYKAQMIVKEELKVLADVVDATVTVVTNDWAAGSHMESGLTVVKYEKPCFVLWLAKPYSTLSPHHIWYDALTTIYDTEEALLAGLEIWANVETTAN